eukprot:1160936-Pelagomonas_calceolata.AAC.16
MALPAEAFVTYRVGNLRFFLQRHLWTQGQRQRHPPVTERHLWTQRQRQKHPAGLRAVHEQGCVPRLQRYKSRDTNSSERCTSKAIKSGERYSKFVLRWQSMFCVLLAVPSSKPRSGCRLHCRCRLHFHAQLLDAACSTTAQGIQLNAAAPHHCCSVSTPEHLGGKHCRKFRGVVCQQQAVCVPGCFFDVHPKEAAIVLPQPQELAALIPAQRQEHVNRHSWRVLHKGKSMCMHPVLGQATARYLKHAHKVAPKNVRDRNEGNKGKRVQGDAQRGLRQETKT